MKVSGWNEKYEQIAASFGYSKKDDLRAAKMLNSILKTPSYSSLEKAIRGRPVFVIGSGPSLASSINILKKYNKVTKICADTALAALLENGIRPQVVVTDLDGDLQVLKRIGRTGTLFVVHAHGDNMDRLEFARNFRKCVGTTQTKKTGRIHNFGGFTDGDRCVFMADFFGATKIFLFGMDFGKRIGSLSRTRKSERKTKLKKLRFAKILLEWLAPQADAELFTLSKRLRGFKKITHRELQRNLQS